ncbi:MAG: hypothetical protein SPF07_04405 [Eubacteriales bacterium]|nr:hypothetical protein [Eubacteriales bacterium]
MNTTSKRDIKTSQNKKKNTKNINKLSNKKMEISNEKFNKKIVNTINQSNTKNSKNNNKISNINDDKYTTKNLDTTTIKSDKNNKKSAKDNVDNCDKDLSLNKKYKKIINGLIWALCVVGILIAIEAIMLIIYVPRYYKVKSNIGMTMLKQIDIEINENQSESKAITIIKNAIGGVEYFQNVKVVSGELKKSQVIRAKASVVDGDGTTKNLDIICGNNWVKGEDNYYYYQYVVTQSKNIDFCNKIILPIDLNKDTDTSNQHIAIFTIESLDYNAGYAGVLWNTPFSQWIVEI